MEPIESLIDRFVETGAAADERLARKILERKEEALPRLIEVVKRDDYWRSEDDDEYWAAIATLHLLPLIGGSDSLGAVVHALQNHAHELNECLTEDMPSILAHFGVDIIDRLEELVLDESMDIFARDAAARAMVILSKDNRPLGNRVMLILRESVLRAKEEYERTILAATMADSKNPDSFQFLASLIDEEKVDRQELSRKELQEIYEGKHDDSLSTTFDGFDMWEYFRHKRWYQPFYEEEARDRKARNMQTRRAPRDFAFWCADCGTVALRAAGLSQTVSGRITSHGEGRAGLPLPSFGRNERCLCGSRKKYKKCCLPLLQGCERINERLEQGYENLPGDAGKACDSWTAAFEAMRRITGKEIKTTNEFDETFPISRIFIRDWADKFEGELWNASLDGNGKRYNATRIEFCDWFCAQFTDEDDETLGRLYAAAAQSTWTLGSVREGEERFDGLVRRFPKYVWGYIHWSDMYWNSHASTAKDYDKAESVLLRCLELTPSDDEDRKDAEERLNRLREERGLQVGQAKSRLTAGEEEGR